ncbi:TonB-dependent receptor plug domain-containing protein [Myroides sp. BIT-d1]|uniref:TonB-dependent receptor plug domain-containing protein n=1 Tax=Myroides albus TaxID=2562892 RepID=A0A6I3LK69_9FLAO|nr:TonB-dependent receptor plug domain-containing protein [Myroides albus]MTG98998.1 TonB-dependent receptor plug domain-containing protein [Myroides albus]
MKLKFCLLSIAFLWVGKVTLFAQTQKDSITTLNEIVIQKEVFKDLIPVQTLSGEALERLNSHSVADALRYFSGVKIKDYGGMGGLKTIDVRNMGTHHVGVFYNGIQIGNAQNGIVDLGKFSLDNVEAIKLYNGQRSTIFQSAKEYASASTVYIQTKKPVFTEGKDVNLSAKYKAGSIQLTNPSIRTEYKINDNVSTTISAEYMHSNGRYKFRQKRHNLNGTVAYDTVGHRLNSDIDAYRIENSWYGKDDKNTWSANLYYYQSDRGLPEAVIKKSDVTLETENINERQIDKNFMGQAEWTRYVSDRYQFLLKAKFAYDLMNYTSRKTVDFQGEEVTYNPQFDNTFYQQDWYISAAHLYKISPIWEVSLSTDLQYNKLNATRKGQGTLFSYPERYTFMTAFATSVDLGKVKAQGNILGTFTNEKVRHNFKAPNRSVWAPSLFVSYKPWNEHNLNIHAFYKYIFRLPTFNDLYYTQLGTSNLRPEISRQFNLGINYNKALNHSFVKEFRVSVESYYANITDKIIASPTSSMMRWMMTNLGKVENYGIESAVGTTLNILPDLDLGINLTYEYTSSKDKSLTLYGKPSYYGDQIPYAPWHSGSSIVELNYKDWGLNYSFIYVGKRYNGNKNNIKRNEIQPWYTHDISLQKSFKWKDYKFKAIVEANNLANQYYEVVTNFPMPGRNFRFTLSIDL